MNDSTSFAGDRPLRVAFATAEVTPFAKTGGLGDVGAALPRSLRRAGHDVRVFLPLYSRIDRRGHEFVPVDFLRELVIRVGGRRFVASVQSVTLPGADRCLYCIDCPELYHRDGIYTQDGDEHVRFAFLARAAIEACQRMGFAPDVFHVNDWHVALLPLYLRVLYDWDHLFDRTRTLLTIHNIAYQGVFGAESLAQLDLADHSSRLHQEDLSRGQVNFLKTGILYAHYVSTVSPTYAQEIQTPDHGMGLDLMLRARSDHLVGILNGVDYGDWDPARDPMIPAHYTREDLEGKRRNKHELLADVGLPRHPDRPLVGMVSRLTPQKGIDLLFEALPVVLREQDVSFVVLGSGEQRYQNFFRWLQDSFPDKVLYHAGYHEQLAHRIEAASDLFLMPSRYEPCGLNQMYSLRYGAVPVVRRTGGLADSVQPWDPVRRTGTGIVFEHYDARAVVWALEKGIGLYHDKDAWRTLQWNGMGQNFSWEVQAQRYVELYRRMLA